MFFAKDYCDAAKMKTLDGMLEFVAVVERKTFTGAARQLGVSVSHISRQIADLESRLAAQLFARTTRQMRLTEPGERLFATCQPLLQELLQAQERVLATHEAIEGKLRVSLAGKFAEEQLVPLLSQFCVAHPAIELEIDVSSRNVDLLAEGFHLAVRMGPLESSTSLMASRLLSVPMSVLVSPQLLAATQTLMSPTDLSPALCLPLVNRTWDFAKGQRRAQVRPTGRFSSNSGAAIIQAAVSGLGVVCVPRYYAEHVVATGQLVEILSDWESVERSIFYLVFPAARHLPLRVRRLMEHLQQGVASAHGDWIPEK